MALIQNSSSQKLPPPPEGIVKAVCINIEDIGIVATQWGDRHKIKVIWAIDVLKQDGTRFNVSKWYTASLYIKSNFRKDLAGWRGRDLTEAELRDGYDYDNLIGMPCQLELGHEKDPDGNTYIRVKRVLPAAEKDPWSAQTPALAQPKAGGAQEGSVGKK